MKTLWKILGGIGLLLVFAFSGAIGKLVGKTSVDSYYAGKKEGSIDEVLFQTASKLNEKLPMMVDSETRWDSTIGINKAIRYNYTLINYSASNITAQDLNNALGQKIVNNVCTTKAMQVFVKNGVTVSYAYYGNEGKQITVISVVPSQCGST
jgi:hypothetical protein